MTEHKSCKSHCCVKHGCKYGYDDCPVETGQVDQDDYCEFCMTLDDINRAQKELDAEFKHWKKINDRKTKEVIEAHKRKLRAKREKKDAR